MSRDNMKIEVATVLMTCSSCQGHIPAGDRYWKKGDTVHEHTNCELYTNEFLRRSHLQKGRK